MIVRESPFVFLASIDAEMPTFEFDTDDLRPLIEAVIAEVMATSSQAAARFDGRLGFPEAEAAALLGVERHVLRDARLRGDIEASLVGKRIVYTPEQLKDYLETNRWRR